MGIIRLFLALLLLVPVTLFLVLLQLILLKTNAPLRRKVPMMWHRLVLWSFGIKVHVVGKITEHRPLLILVNHISWLDILVIGAQFPCTFVAKSEIASWPLFGFLAKLQNSIFVERERRSKTGDTASEMADRMTHGDPVILFAEGTSGDGNSILPFRSALVGATQGLVKNNETENVWLQPLSLSFTRIHGIPMGRQFRHKVSWMGELSLLPHLLEVVRIGAIDTELHWGEVLPINAETSRKQITVQAENQIREMFSQSLGNPV